MELLLNLYLGHLLGDFVFQPGVLVAAKRARTLWLLVHVGIIGLCTVAVFYTDIASLWYIILLAMTAHLLIEIVTIRLRRGNRLSGLSILLIDQGLHILSLVLLVRIAAPYTEISALDTFGLNLGPVNTALLCACVGATFMGSILVFEVVNVFGPPSQHRNILPYDTARFLGMAERGAALLMATLLPAALDMTQPILPIVLLIAAFVPRVLFSLKCPAEERAHQMLIVTTGLITCAIGWTLVAGVALAHAT